MVSPSGAEVLKGLVGMLKYTPGFHTGGKSPIYSLNKGDIVSLFCWAMFLKMLGLGRGRLTGTFSKMSSKYQHFFKID
jgi:hypothetical protein